MFTGIVHGTCAVVRIQQELASLGLTIDLGSLADNLQDGQSVAINGVCLTATSSSEGLTSFDVIRATAAQTNLRSLTVGVHVNVERSLRIGDEIGGHMLSGHIADTVKVTNVVNEIDSNALSFEVPDSWVKFLMPKGFVALNGVSLTLADLDRERKSGSVNLIPETLERTNLKDVHPGDFLNLEVDSQTQSIVTTVEEFLMSRNIS